MAKEMARGCGTCNLCCKFLAVPELNKPAMTLCTHTGVHGGCDRHADKPLSCVQFRCLWLDSQSNLDPALRQPRYMRPDQCHVMFGPQDSEDPKILNVYVDANFPAAWREPDVANWIEQIVARGLRPRIIIGSFSAEVSV